MTGCDMIAIMSNAWLDLFNLRDNQERVLVAGAYLFHQGDPVRNLFQAVEGEVQLIRHQENGGTIVLQRAQPGDIVAAFRSSEKNSNSRSDVTF